MKNLIKYMGRFLGIAVIIVTAISFISCSDGGDDGNGDPPPKLPAEFQETTWNHSSGIKLEFKTDKVIVTPSGGSGQEYKYQKQSEELGDTVLHFKTSGEQAAFVVVNSSGVVISASFPNIGIKPGDWTKIGLLVDGMTFILDPSGSYTLTKYSGNKKNVEIPPDVNGKPVTSIGNGAFGDCTSLASITIPDSVTSSIGDYAFRNCTSLASVTIGNSVTSIGEHAFENCTSLTSVTIGNSVTSIGNSTFSGCVSLASITIPDSVTSIEYDAFHNSLASVTFQGTITADNFSSSAFFGDLRTKYLAGGIGTYTSTGSGDNKVWTKQ